MEYFPYQKRVKSIRLRYPPVDKVPTRQSEGHWYSLNIY
jgi:hypothetical protein